MFFLRAVFFGLWSGRGKGWVREHRPLISLVTQGYITTSETFTLIYLDYLDLGSGESLQLIMTLL